MRRTYRSKKDAGGAFDPRDVLQTDDEKSSAFDAFYIQNIKQTKREMSCIGSSNQYVGASKKVRKRKYVKRIIKEVELAPRESLSQSVFLTPDKSIRVNKAYDPFDMLLNSSPASKENDKVDKIEKIQPKRGGKTYTKKQPLTAKKFNGDSSSPSDSDKENSCGGECYTTSNTSDIRSHKLLVEREPSNSPNNLDDSIKKIVNNIPYLKNINQHRNNSGSIRTSFRFKRNRLTINTQSPILQKSPLCSTPFKAKYRDVSIFKFSPISVKDQIDSPNYVNNSFTYSSNRNKNGCEPTTSEDDPQTSRVTSQSYKCEPNNISIETQSNESVLYKDSTCNHFKRESDVMSDNKPISSISSMQTTELEPFFGFIKKKDENSNDEIASIDESSHNTEKYLNINPNETETEINNVTVSIVTEHSNESVLSDENEKSASLTSDCQDEEKGSFYDTCSSGQGSLDGEMKTISLKPTVEIERMNDSLFLKYYKKIKDLDSDQEVSKSCPSDSSIRSDNDDDFTSYESDIERLSSNSLNIENCNMLAVKKAFDLSVETNNEIFSSNEDELDSNNEEDRLISFVTTRKRNEVTNSSIMSVLDDSISSTIYNCDKTILSNAKKYSTEKLNGSNDSSEVINADYTFQENILNSEDLNEQSFNNELDDIRTVARTGRSSILKKTTRLNSSEMNATLEDSGDELNDINELDMRTSITFRKSLRRLGDTEKSKSPEVDVNCVLETDDKLNITSFTSEQDIRKPITIGNSSRPLRVTARSNSAEIDCNLEDTLICNELNETSLNDEQNTRKSIVIGMNYKEPTPTSSNPELKFRKSKHSITNRKSTNLVQKASPESTKQTDPDWKPIVLQPGKKWERSLSIYRRMSMITDHFDQSILEDEPMQTKGRKYRQSVISTMEMQELNGSQHNESINSRRSTFVSKPIRSTIRILKDPNSSRVSLCNTAVFDDSKGFLNDECDDTIIELSKLSIADAGSEVTVLDIHEKSNRIATARDYVLRRCNQTEAILFDECYPDSVLKNCQKIGEGVYGEVFLWRDRDGRARVMKVVPVAGDIKVNGEHQKQFHEIISEIEIAMELSALRAPIAEINLHLNEGKDAVELDLTAIENATDVFNEVRAVRCVYGSYPSRLLDLWDLYDECKGSENDNPAILPVDQQYIVLELANAGQDLESYQFNNAEQAHALFLQVAFALAVGEEAYQFEHRDLHWGNVLIAPTDEKLATFVVRGRAYRVPRCGVSATVIDYSLSRLSAAGAPSPSSSAVFYNDLSSDDGLFDAVGDYQFEVYRLMRDKLGNDWKNFEPYTNILWLHYTVDKMITALRYKRVNTKIHKHYIEKLKGIKNRILQYGSTVQFVLTDNEF